jgi:DNA-binding response OmpR family regulator
VNRSQSQAVASRTVLVVADDLIWASRLTGAVERAGASSHVVRTLEDLAQRYENDSPSSVIVDLSGRGYDGVAAVHLAASKGATVLGVGQHEDAELRRRALAAGARRVLSYNKLFTDGPRIVAALLAGRY